MMRSFSRSRGVAIALVVGVAACGGGGSKPDAAIPDARLEGFDKPDLICPGGAGCASAGDGVLKVGAAKRTFTPPIAETYTDENMNRTWESTEPYVDANGNHRFDGIWLFGGARAALGVTTDVEVRTLAFVQGDTTVVILYADCIGLLVGDIKAIRKHPTLAGLNIDHIIIGATHAHDSPDTVGLWGRTPLDSGRDPGTMKLLIDRSAEAIKDAVEHTSAAHMVIAKTLMINDPSDTRSKSTHFAQDFRDPIIFDPTLTIARFIKVSSPTETIGTLVNWADHPEVAHFSEDDPATITAHFPHWLRNGIEQGLTKAEVFGLANDVPGIGGVTVYVQGAVGGQIGSIRDTALVGPDGTPVTKENHAKDMAIGKNVAARALQALATTGETVSDLPLTMRTAAYNARIDNNLFQTAFILKLIAPHPLVGYDTESALGDDNAPWMPLRTTYLQIGPLGLITAPGELHPELWVGGYDGSRSWGYTMLDPAKPNAPNMMTAPKPPYLRDLVLANPGVRYPVLAGLAQDYVGYIVPAYNYVLHPQNPYSQEAPGDHYEEVYSLGPLVEQHTMAPVNALAAYR
jgi:hypothetical protein